MFNLTSAAESIFLKALGGLTKGHLEITNRGVTHEFGSNDDALRAVITVHDARFFRRALFDGDIGIGESYMAGEWTSPDVGNVIRLAVRNLDHLETSNSWFSAFTRAGNRIQHMLKSNTVTRSKQNIEAHYDLSNEFFGLFLDDSMMYSCGWFDSASDSLERAQFNKLEKICRKLQLQEGDRVLEIGTGWGGFALHAASKYGAHVTTTTISRQQYDFAARRFHDFDPAGERIHLLMDDYRKLKGNYDKIVSIEMFEAVGLDYYDEFFSTCDRLLNPDGAMLMQTITMLDQKFPAYHRSSDWIQKYIFPGGELASMAEILKSTSRATRLALFNAEDMGLHYARTLDEWRGRFMRNLGAVRNLGFDEKFTRMWEFYLAYCEGAFLERHVSTTQLMFTKAYSGRVLSGEEFRMELARAMASRRS